MHLTQGIAAPFRRGITTVPVRYAGLVIIVSGRRLPIAPNCLELAVSDHLPLGFFVAAVA
jgi:hypothetical protein